MNSARLLFARPRQGASLAPIYAALLSLVALGLIAFAVALWPEGAEPFAPRRDAGKVAPASGNAVVGPGRTQKLRPAPGPGRWA
jgi:hypothetical protein